MVKFKPFQSFALVLLAGALIGAAADRAISRLDVRAMSDGDKNKQVRKDLLSILLPSKSLYESRQLTLDGEAWLHTKASATRYKSLCQRDMVSLFYVSIENAGQPGERRALPYKIESQRSYRFVAPPKPEYLADTFADDHPRSPLDRECRKADKVLGDNEWGGWFVTSSAELAMDGGFAMLALEQWAKQPDTQFGNCIGDKDPAFCKSYVSYALDLNLIGAVATCAPDKPATVCLQLGEYGQIFTIRARKTGKQMQAADIVGVDYETQIIVT